MNDSIEHFAGDLRACGIDERDVAKATHLYDRALVRRSESAWRRFYLATFRALSRGAERASPRSVTAVESLMRLFGDDLGAALFDTGAIAQLGLRLREPASASRRGEGAAPA